MINALNQRYPLGWGLFRVASQVVTGLGTTPHFHVDWTTARAAYPMPHAIQVTFPAIRELTHNAHFEGVVMEIDDTPGARVRFPASVNGWSVFFENLGPRNGVPEFVVGLAPAPVEEPNMP
jgi:hypothetical protein